VLEDGNYDVEEPGGFLRDLVEDKEEGLSTILARLWADYTAIGE
jgi:hypothetical protein